MITTYEVVVHCDHPGCSHEIHVMDPEDAKEHGWLIRLVAGRTQRIPLTEDFCPDHGRCSWCKERNPRTDLAEGRGECKGQMICTTCIWKREG